MDEILKTINNNLTGWTLDHAETGTGRGEIKLIFESPTGQKSGAQYTTVTIKDVKASDVSISKL